MKYVWLWFVFSSQIASASYWQQKINYDIQCRLDDKTNQLTGAVKVTYQNNSPFALNQVKLHLWMNAFKSKHSPFDDQLKHVGDAKKWVLQRADFGGYDSLDFYNLQGAVIPFSYDDATQEIITLSLDQAIQSGSSGVFTIKYALDIPKNISRGGHLNQSYQMTQWYPKVALLDSSGWHTMHYLEYGEFFNDFGDYRVKIELPDNYIVASTGTLLDSEELKFLDDYADSCQLKNGEPADITILAPISSTRFKILSYQAKNVIDFAWFADKRFLVNKAKAIVEDKTIDIWTFFLPKKINAWHQASIYGKNAIEYFSYQVGPYPYDQVSIVECQKAGADGMEYPMITLIDRYYNLPENLEEVILHELGHNWFQAVLATDEREEAWLDEGLVTFYEHKYFQKRPMSPFIGHGLFTLNSDYDVPPDFLWYLQAADNRDMAVLAPVEKYAINGYILSTYEKPAKGLRLLEQAVGEQIFKSMMQKYFESFKFKHPKQQDLLGLFHSIGIHWFEETYLTNNKKLDIDIHKASSEGFIVNHHGPKDLPLPMAGYYKGKRILDTTLINLTSGTPFKFGPDSLDYIIIDPDFLLPEIKRTNNILRLRPSAFTPKKTVMHLIPGIGHSLTNDLYLSPVIGYNDYDGFQAGLALHDFTLPAATTLGGAIVAYGFKSTKPVILAGIEHAIFPYQSYIDRIKFGVELRNFSNNRDTHYEYTSRYLKLAPKISLSLTPGAQHSALKEFSYRPVYIHQQTLMSVDFDQGLYKSIGQSKLYHELKYDYLNSKALQPYDWSTTAEKGPGFIKLFSHFNKQFRYHTVAPAHLEWHVFGGIQSTDHSNKTFSNFTLSGGTAFNGEESDYKFDELLLGRAETTNSFSRQIFIKDAAFRSLPSMVSSTSWMLASSLRSSIPTLPFIRPYFQLALTPKTNTYGSIHYTSGISLVGLKNILEVNFPAFESQSIREGPSNLTHSKYLQRCTYVFNFKALSPFKWLRKIGG